MKHTSNDTADNVMAMVGFLLALPAIYFFIGSFSKYELGLLVNVDILVPHPVVMIGGLLLAIILNSYPLMRQRANSTVSSYQTIRARPLNTIILLLGLLFLILLVGYVLVENLAEMDSVKNIQ